MNYVIWLMKLSDHITVNNNIQFGKPVFKNTRVPVQSLFWHLEKGISLDEFLEDFPSVNRAQAEAVIEWAGQYFSLPEIITDETIAG